MNNDVEMDMALAALLAVAQEEAPELPTELVRKAFMIQKRHQFDREEQNSASVQDMQTLIENHVETQLGAK